MLCASASSSLRHSLLALRTAASASTIVAGRYIIARRVQCSSRLQFQSISRCAIHTSARIATSSAPAAASASSSPSAAVQTLTLKELLKALQTNEISVPLPSPHSATAATSSSSIPSPVIRVRGWLRSIRTSKATSFLQLNDGTSVLSLQCVTDAPVLEVGLRQGEQLTNGCSVEIEGRLVWTHRVAQGMLKQISEGGQPASFETALTPALHTTAASAAPQMPLIELLASSIRLIGACDPEAYPMAKKSLPLEHLRDHLHLRTRTNTLAAVMRIRSAAQMGVHTFFTERGFVNVHTPIITPLDCEGAGEVFQVTSSSDKPATTTKNADGTVQDQPAQHFFNKPTYLTVSGQLYAEMLACSLSKVYTFGPTFRAENSQTVRHLNEFMMIEPEVAHADLDGLLQLGEEFVKFMITHILKQCDTDLRFLQSRFNPALLQTLASVSSSSTPFARITYTEAIDLLQKSKQKWEFAPKWDDGLQLEHEKWLADVKFKKPVFITHYPRAQKPFYMKANASSLSTPGRETVNCFDLIIPGVGELIGGSEREDSYEQLLQNMKEHQLDPKLYQWYLELRTYGTVPHGGFGVGFERLLRYVTSMANIRDLIPVPRTPGNGQF